MLCLLVVPTCPSCVENVVALSLGCVEPSALATGRPPRANRQDRMNQRTRRWLSGPQSPRTRQINEKIPVGPPSRFLPSFLPLRIESTKTGSGRRVGDQHSVERIQLVGLQLKPLTGMRQGRRELSVSSLAAFAGTWPLAASLAIAGYLTRHAMRRRRSRSLPSWPGGTEYEIELGCRNNQCWRMLNPFWAFLTEKSVHVRVPEVNGEHLHLRGALVFPSRRVAAAPGPPLLCSNPSRRCDCAVASAGDLHQGRSGKGKACEG